MRRLLVLPAIALVLLGTPVLAAESTKPPRATTDEVALAPAGQTVQSGWESAVTPVDAQLVGVTWDGDPDAEFTVEVQSTAGTWTAAPEIEAETSADAGTNDADRAAQMPDNGSAPVWVGADTQAVRVVLDEGEAKNVEIAAVDTPPATAPSGSAGALGGWLPVVDGPGRYLFAIVVFGVAALLLALAFGWTPWRSRRVRRLAAVLTGAAVLAACVPGGGIPLGSERPAMTMRSGWGARAFACDEVDYAASLRFAVVHHTVNGNSYGPADSPSIVRGIQAYHIDALGYCDIAYHFLIDRFGKLFEGRYGGIANPVIGGHAGGFNTGSVGVALIGDYSGVGVPQGQWNVLVHLLRWRLSVGGVDPSRGFWQTVASSPCGCVRWPPGSKVYFPNAIVGHIDLDYTSCPGTVQRRMAELRSAVQSGIRIVPTTSTSTTSTTLGTTGTQTVEPTTTTTTTAPPAPTTTTTTSTP